MLGARSEDQRDGTGALASGDRARGQGQREHDVFARPEGHVLRLIRAEDEIGERGPVFGGQRRGQNPAVDPERDLASRDGLELRREGIIEQEAHAQRAENVRIGQPDRDRHRHELQHAAGLREEAETVMAGDRIPNRGLARDGLRRGRRRADRRQQPARAVGDEQQVRLELIQILVGDVLHRGGIVGVHRGLEPWIARDELRAHREGFGAGLMELFDERAGRQNLALQRVFGLPRRASAHDVDRRPDRQHGQQRAGQEDPAAEGRERLHRRTKSSSVAPPSGTAAGLGSENSPSFQAITL